MALEHIYRTVISDANSPLTKYAYFLTIICQDLGDRVERDAQAVEILKTEPALALAQQRAGLRCANEMMGRHWGRIVKTSRVWTRRDERRVLMDRGYETGYWPVCRARRYAIYVLPRFDELFRQAVHEARGDGMISMVGDLLTRSKEAFVELREAVHAVSGPFGDREDFNEARWKLAAIAAELFDWTKPPKEPDAEIDNRKRDGKEDLPKNAGRSGKRQKDLGESSQLKFVAALTLHHRYENGSYLNAEPIGNNELARQVGVSKKTASKFFQSQFGSHASYAQMCGQRERFIGAMKALNSEYIPRDFLSARSPDEVKSDDE